MQAKDYNFLSIAVNIILAACVLYFMNQSKVQQLEIYNELHKQASYDSLESHLKAIDSRLDSIRQPSIIKNYNTLKVNYEGNISKLDTFGFSFRELRARGNH